jgi:hypothetical protein
MSHLMSLSGVKRTWPIAVQMSAYDPGANRVRPTFLVQGWSVTFLLQQFVVANASAASERRIV